MSKRKIDKISYIIVKPRAEYYISSQKSTLSITPEKVLYSVHSPGDASLQNIREKIYFDVTPTPNYSISLNNEIEKIDYSISANPVYAVDLLLRLGEVAQDISPISTFVNEETLKTTTIDYSISTDSQYIDDLYNQVQDIDDSVETISNFTHGFIYEYFEVENTANVESNFLTQKTSPEDIASNISAISYFEERKIDQSNIAHTATSISNFNNKFLYRTLDINNIINTFSEFFISKSTQTSVTKNATVIPEFKSSYLFNYDDVSVNVVTSSNFPKKKIELYDIEDTVEAISSYESISMDLYTDVETTVSAESNFITISDDILFILSGMSPSQANALLGHLGTVVFNAATIGDLTISGDTISSDGNIVLDAVGDVLINGETIRIDKEMTTTDNIIVLNDGEIGNGITAGLAGLQFDRGIPTDYQIVFQESNELFSIGEIGNLQAVATRADSMVTGGIGYWDSTQKFVNSTNAKLTSSGVITATSFLGNGSGLTHLNASNLLNGTVPSARISGSYTGITEVGTLTELTVGNLNNKIGGIVYTNSAGKLLNSSNATVDLNGNLSARSGNFSGSSFPVLNITRATGITDNIASGVLVMSKTTGDMEDGYGGGILFGLNDDTETSSSNYVARIYATRDGADNLGALELRTGGNNLAMILRASGDVGIGTENPSEKLQVKGFTRADSGYKVSTTTVINSSRAGFLTDLTLTGKLTGVDASLSSTLDVGGVATFKDFAVLEKQATGTTHAVRADRLISAGNGLTGGGNLTTDKTITLGTPSTLTVSTTNNASASSHTHVLDLSGRTLTISNDTDDIITWNTNTQNLGGNRTWTPTIADASASQRGVVNTTGTQIFAGIKQFNNNITFADQIVSTGTFVSGFAGSGALLDKDFTTSDGVGLGAYLEVDNLTVRERFRVYELLINQIRATNGALWISSTAKVDSVTDLGSGVWRCFMPEDQFVPFLDNDLVRAQRFTGSGTYLVEGEVTAIENGSATVTDNTTARYFEITLEAGSDTPTAGMELVRIGNSTDSTRQGSLYLTSDDTGAPYMDVINDVDSFSTWNNAEKNKARIGRLDGLTVDGVQLEGYGLYGSNVYLTDYLLVGDLSKAGQYLEYDGSSFTIITGSGNLDTVLGNHGSDISANASGLSSLSSTVSTLGDTVSANSSAITSINSNIDDIESDVSGNASGLSSLETRVSSAEGNISSNASAITGIESDLYDGSTGLSATASALSSLTTTVSNLDGVVSSNSSAITTLESDLGDVESDVSSNASAITSLTTRVSDNEGDITSISGSITSINSSIGDIESDISGNSSAITSLNTSVSDIEGDITSISSAITSIESDLYDATTGLGALSTGLNSLETTVSNIDGEVSANAIAISGVQSEINDSETGLSALSSAVVTLETNVGDLQSSTATISADIVTIEGDISSAELRLDAVEGLGSTATLIADNFNFQSGTDFWKTSNNTFQFGGTDGIIYDGTKVDIGSDVNINGANLSVSSLPRVSDEGLKAYYNFDIGDDVNGLFDKKGNYSTVNARNLSGASLVDSPIGKAINLTTAGNHYTIDGVLDGLDETSAFSLSVLVKINNFGSASSGYTSIISNNRNYGNSVGIYTQQSTARITFAQRGDSSTRTTANNAQIGVWYHCVLVIDPSDSSAKLRAYVDGEYIGGGGAGSIGTWSSGDFRIGNINTWGNSIGDNDIDVTAVRVWDKAIDKNSADELDTNLIKSLYLYPSGNSGGLISADTVVATEAFFNQLTTYDATIKSTLTLDPLGIIKIGAGNFANADTALYLGASGLSLTDKFSVTSAGKLTATGADITGKITASDGEIGGFNITDTYIGSEFSTSSNNRAYMSPTEFQVGDGASQGAFNTFYTSVLSKDKFQQTVSRYNSGAGTPLHTFSTSLRTVVDEAGSKKARLYAEWFDGDHEGTTIESSYLEYNFTDTDGGGYGNGRWNFGSGLTVNGNLHVSGTVSADGGYHPSIEDSSEDIINSGAKFIQGLTFDEYGHVTGSTSTTITPSTIGAEPSISKNNAFNKNFGTASDTVAQGNDSRINNGQTAFGWGNHSGLYALVGRSITAGNGLSGGGTLAANRTITLGTPGAITLSSTNSVATSSHTHAFTPGGTTAQYIRGDGSLATYANTTYSNMSITELNAGTVTTARSISAKTLTDWGNGKYALRSRTITGTGSLTGGGNLTANRTLDLTSTAKSDITKGVTAHGWGNHGSEGYIKSYVNYYVSGNPTFAPSTGVLTIPMSGVDDKTVNLDGRYLTTESDPTVPAHVKGITTTNINRWTSAYNHSNLKSNPHEITKGDLSLDNVENKSSATIRGEITLGNVTTALGFTPATSGHSHPQLNGNGAIQLGSNIGNTSAVGAMYYNEDQTNYELRANIEGTWRGLWHQGNHSHRTDAQNDSRYKLDFNENTGFNKPFGTFEGSVAKGNHSHTFASLDFKPTSLSGYGITDAYTKGDTNLLLDTKSNTGHGHSWSDITSPSTVSKTEAEAGTSTTQRMWTAQRVAQAIDAQARSSTWMPTASQVGAANATHFHHASDINDGVFPIARIPTGTTDTTVAKGNHTHTGYLTTSGTAADSNKLGGSPASSYATGTDLAQYRLSSNVSFSSNIDIGTYVRHIGDTNTYFGFPTNDTIDFFTNNTRRIRITSAGRVGIGTASPTQPLHVVGNATSTGINYASDHQGTSDRRIKSEIHGVDSLQIASFASLKKYKKEGIDGWQYGLIAQDMMQYNSDIVGKLEHAQFGEIYTLSDYSIASIALDAARRLNENKAEKSEMESLRNRVSQLESQIIALGGSL